MPRCRRKLLRLLIPFIVAADLLDEFRERLVEELSLPPESKLCLIIPKQQKPHLPTASTIIQAEDQIIAVTTPDSEEALNTTLRGL